MAPGPRAWLWSTFRIVILPCVIVIPTVLACWALGEAQTTEPSAAAGSYIGAQACGLCHRDLAASWSGSAHGAALSNPSLPADSLGCEACHGPGSVHAGSTGKQKLPDPAKLSPAEVEAMCGKCHLPSESAAPTSSSPSLDTSAWRRSGHRAGKVACTACHSIHGNRSTTLVAPAEKLCLTCHSDLTKSDHGQAHAPVAAGQCLLCHDPHGTPGAHGLRKDVSRSCEQCHKPDPAAHEGYQVSGSNCVRCHDPHSFDGDRAYLRKVAHPPFAQGNCKLCHTDPPSTQLRNASVAETCSACHSQEKIVSGGDPALSGLHAHAPAAAGLCTKCHEPHVSDAPDGLADTPEAVCSACHRNVGTTARSTAHQHPPAAKGECLSCHAPHASVQRALLRKDQSDLCKTCHSDQTAHAHPIGPEVKDPNTGDPVVCTSCHAVHGSEYSSILRQDETAMCLTCHRMEHLGD